MVVTDSCYRKKDPLSKRFREFFEESQRIPKISEFEIIVGCLKEKKTKNKSKNKLNRSVL